MQNEYKKRNNAMIKISALGILLLLVGCTSAKMPWEDPNYAKDTPATIADSRAEERAKGGWTAFIKHHENRKQWVSEKPVDLLMIGDSIIFEYSRSAGKIWDEYYGKRNAVNIASSGDSTQHMLWHIQDGGLDGMKDRNPKVVVVLLGTNNRGELEKKGQDTALGILALLKEIHSRLPKSKIVLMALLPRGWTPDDKGRIRNNEINEIIKGYADNKTVYWLDVGHVFLDKDGNLSRELIKDALHPSTPKGYQALSEAMEPTIKKLLGE
jgi:lysophospholipase L1-like esterase